MENYLINFVSESSDKYSVHISANKPPISTTDFLEIIRTQVLAEYEVASQNNFSGPGIGGTYLHIDEIKLLETPHAYRF